MICGQCKNEIPDDSNFCPICGKPIRAMMDQEKPTSRISISKKKIIAFALTIIVAISAGAGYYFLYYIRTPEYTLKIIQTAVKNHDLNTFHEHVDVDAIVNSYVDAELKNAKPDALGMQFVPLARKILVIASTKMIDNAVLGKEDSDKSPPDPNEPIENVLSKKNEVIVEGISSKKINDNMAEIDVKLKNTKRYTEITLKLDAKRLNYKTWQIYSISNLGDLAQL